jgi:hypothetical protein
MAFEVPLEADRVDDLNLFSTFVRAPVIGTLMWILGGDKAKEEDMQRTQQLHDSSTEQDDAPCTDRSSLKRVKVKHSSLKKVAPSLLGSEVSDVGEIRDGLDSMCFDDTEPMLEGSGSRFEPGRQKRELSWSDEIGKDLVVYCEKVRSYKENRSSRRPSLVSSCMVRGAPSSAGTRVSNTDTSVCPSFPRKRPCSPVLRTSQYVFARSIRLDGRPCVVQNGQRHRFFQSEFRGGSPEIDTRPSSQPHNKTAHFSWRIEWKPYCLVLI